jgi:formate dehydrogenase maturation protein FdhE
MTDGYEEDAPPRKIKMSSNADLLEYRIESMEREIRTFKVQADRKNRELDELIQKRFQELAKDAQRLSKETAEKLEKKDKEILDENEKSLKEVEDDFDKRTSRIESFLLGGLCLVATLFIGALFAITNGTVPGGSG